MKIVKKLWGHELWIVNYPEYCGKLLFLNFGSYCSYHYHKLKKETFYILKGKVLMFIDGQKIIMCKGDVITLEPFTKHRFVGLRNSIILEISTQHFENDSYRDTKSGSLNLWKKFLILLPIKQFWLLEI